MAKRMSKTLAAEIAERTLVVVNPQNRPLALNASLQRHGFITAITPKPDQLLDRTAIVNWLLATYAAAE
jgi:hypothetical protein